MHYRGLDIFADSYSSWKDSILITTTGFYYPNNGLIRGLPFSTLDEYSFCSFKELHNVRPLDKALKLKEQTIYEALSDKKVISTYKNLRRLSLLSNVTIEDIYAPEFSTDSLVNQICEIRNTSLPVRNFQIAFTAILLVFPLVLMFLPSVVSDK